MRYAILLIVSLLLFPFPALAEDYRTVAKVLDGDTVILDKDETVRLIGIDTAELRRSSKPLMYYAEEAYKFTKQLCEAKKIKLQFDEANSANNHIDKYGRTLAYIYLEDGTFVNAEIVRQGYAFYYAKFPFKYMDEFRQYQREAMEDEKGLWAKLVYDPLASNIIMYYEKLDDGKKMPKEDRIFK